MRFSPAVLSCPGTGTEEEDHWFTQGEGAFQVVMTVGERGGGFKGLCSAVLQCQNQESMLKRMQWVTDSENVLEPVEQWLIEIRELLSG